VGLPVVLVHGGGHGAWCWARLLPHLTAEALAVDLPPRAVRGGPDRFAPLPELATLTAADFATSVLADADAAGIDRFVLVRHSLAGVTIPEVARLAPRRVAHLVFLSCAVPEEGTSVVEMRGADAPERSVVDARESPGSGEASAGPGLPEALLRQMFGTDLDEEAMQLGLDRFGGEAMRLLTDPVSRAGVPPDIPKTWIRLLRDVAVPVALQDANIGYLEASPGGPVAVVDLDTGHDAMLSRPAELAVILDGIAGRAV